MKESIKIKINAIMHLLGGLWLASIGLRMTTQFMYGIDWVMGTPMPLGVGWSTWDYWFDWFPMTIFGSYITLVWMTKLLRDILNTSIPIEELGNKNV